MHKRACALLTAGLMLLCCGCSADNNSSSEFSYDSKAFWPFMLRVNNVKINFFTDRIQLKDNMTDAYRDLQEKSKGTEIISCTKDDTDKSSSINTKEFSVTNINKNGSLVEFSNGLFANSDDDTISDKMAQSVSVKGSDDFSYYFAYYTDGKEIDYSKVSFDGTDTDDSNMSYKLKDMACTDYCSSLLNQKKISNFECITFETSEKKCCLATLKICTLKTQEDK